MTLRISSVFHSRSGTLSGAGEALCSSWLRVGVGAAGRALATGVTSLSSRSKARPSPASGSTVRSLSPMGVRARASLGSEETGSSRAVLNDSARDEG